MTNERLILCCLWREGACWRDRLVRSQAACVRVVSLVHVHACGDRVERDIVAAAEVTLRGDAPGSLENIDV